MCSNDFLNSYMRANEMMPGIEFYKSGTKKASVLFCSFSWERFLSNKALGCSTRSCLFLFCKFKCNHTRTKIIVIIFSTLCLLLTFFFALTQSSVLVAFQHYIFQFLIFFRRFSAASFCYFFLLIALGEVFDFLLVLNFNQFV